MKFKGIAKAMAEQWCSLDKKEVIGK